jgi:hypothetical protein
MTNRPTFLQSFGAWYISQAIRYFVVAIVVAAWIMLFVFIGWLFDLEQETRIVLSIAIPVFAMLAYGLYRVGWVVIYSIRIKLGQRPRRRPW